MAENTIDIAGASQDLQTIEDFVNLPVGSDVRPRLLPSVNVGTLAGTRDAIFRAGGLPAEPFANKALMEASALPNGKYAMVTDDATASNNALYVKNGGIWVKSKYDFSGFVKTYMSENGFAKIYTNAGSVDFSTATNTLTFNSLLYVTTAANGSFTIPSPVPVIIEGVGSYRIEFNQKTNGLRAVLASSGREVDWLVAAYVTRTATGFFTNDFLGYTVNGIDPNAKIDEAKLGVIVSNKSTTININKVTGKLETLASGRLISGNNSYFIPTSSVNLPNTTGAYRVEFNPLTSSIEINLSSDTIKPKNVIFARLSVPLVGQFDLYGVDLYSVNGVSMSSPIASRGDLVPTSASDLDFDFDAKTLTVVGYTVRLQYGRESALLKAQVLDLSPDFSKWVALVYDIVSGFLSVKRVNNKITATEITVGYLNVLERKVIGIPFYTVNGNEQTEAKDDPYAAKFLIPYTIVDMQYHAAEQLSMADIESATRNKVAEFYALYDDLVTRFPSYVSMRVAGLDALGNDIREYRFNAPEVVRTPPNKPKIILFSGVHGGERGGIYNLYNVMRLICETWKTDPALEALRWGVDIVTVPLGVPSGFVLGTRKNHNEVDIARNFEAGWQLVTDTTSSQYGGTAPLSELETQVLDGVMTAHSDAIMFSSLHSFSALTNDEMPKGVFCWNAAASMFSMNLAKVVITRNTIAAKKRYSWINQDDDVYLGYTSLTAPPGSESMQAHKKYGIQGSTFEINAKLYWEVDGEPSMSAAVTTLGAEALINWILINIRYAPEYYNAKINI